MEILKFCSVLLYCLSKDFTVGKNLLQQSLQDNFFLIFSRLCQVVSSVSAHKRVWVYVGEPISGGEDDPSHNAEGKNEF